MRMTRSPHRRDEAGRAKPPTEPGVVPGIAEAMLEALTDLPQRVLIEPPDEPAAFDDWLRPQLAKFHAALLTEPVPDRLLRILGVLGR